MIDKICLAGIVACAGFCAYIYFFGAMARMERGTYQPSAHRATGIQDWPDNDGLWTVLPGELDNPSTNTCKIDREGY